MGRSVAQGRPADPGADAGATDAAPFAPLLLARGMARLGLRRGYGMLPGMSLIVASLAVNAWGGLWSRVLGW